MRITKHINLSNTCLDIVYVVLLLITIVFLVWYMIIGERFLHFVDAEMSFNAWKDGYQDTEKILEATANTSQDLACHDPSILNYWWDSDGTWAYTNYTCLELCDGPGIFSNGTRCAQPLDFISSPTHHSAFFVTEFKESIEDGPQQGYILPTEKTGDIFKVGFNYGFDVHIDHFFNLRKAHVTANAPDKGAITVVLDEKRMVSKIIEPGAASVEFTMNELLKLGGVSGILDDVNAGGGKNYYPGAQRTDGPSYRISGLELTIRTECYWQTRAQPEGIRESETLKKILSNSDLPACYFMVEPSEQAWTYRYEEKFPGGVKYATVYHGVHVKLHGTCRFGSANVIAIIDFLIVALVLLPLPKHIMTIFACNLLGTLSKVYKRVSCEQFNIWRSLGGFAAHVLTQGHVFLAIRDGSHEGHDFISRDSLEWHVQKFLAQQSRLDAAEVKAMSNCIYDAAVYGFEFHETALDNTTHGSIIRFAKEHWKKCLRGHKQQDRHDERRVIDIRQFTQLSQNEDAMTIDDIVDLFDVDRPLGHLERFFIPASLHYMRRAPQNSVDFGDFTTHGRTMEKEIPSVSASTTHVAASNCHEDRIKVDYGDLTTYGKTMENGIPPVSASTSHVVASNCHEDRIKVLERKFQEFENKMKVDLIMPVIEDLKVEASLLRERCAILEAKVDMLNAESGKSDRSVEKTRCVRRGEEDLNHDLNSLRKEMADHQNFAKEMRMEQMRLRETMDATIVAEMKKEVPPEVAHMRQVPTRPAQLLHGPASGSGPSPLKHSTLPSGSCVLTEPDEFGVGGANPHRQSLNSLMQRLNMVEVSQGLWLDGTRLQ